VATVSHEVRNPLTMVLGFADALRDGLRQSGDLELAELAELIGDQGREMNNIIEDLLVAARTEVGSLTIVPDEVDLADGVRTVVRGCVCVKDVRDAIALDLDVATVWADASRVRQIIRNPLTNAIRYGGDSIKVVVRSSEAESTGCVCADGPGIPPDQRETVYRYSRFGFRRPGPQCLPTASPDDGRGSLVWLRGRDEHLYPHASPGWSCRRGDRCRPTRPGGLTASENTRG